MPEIEVKGKEEEVKQPAEDAASGNLKTGTEQAVLTGNASAQNPIISSNPNTDNDSLARAMSLLDLLDDGERRTTLAHLQHLVNPAPAFQSTM